MVVLLLSEISQSLEGFLAISVFENARESVFGFADQLVEIG
jgi:hypothetical protein